MRPVYVLLALLMVVSPASAATGAWFPAAADLSAAGQNVFSPQVAVGPDGTATAVWQQSIGANGTIQASTRPPGGAWSAPADVSGPGTIAREPQIAIAADGTTIVLWYRGSIVQASSRRRPAGVWSTPGDLTVAGQTVSDLRLAVAPDGQATAIWTVGNDVVQTSSRPPGGTWSAPTGLTAAGEAGQRPNVAVAADGTVTAVWFRRKNAIGVVQTASRPPGGAWSAPRDLSTPGQESGNPEVAVAADGTTAVIWMVVVAANEWNVQAAVRPPGGIWTAPRTLSLPGGRAAPGEVAVAADGTITAVWGRYDGISTTVQASTRGPGGTWGAPVDISAAGQDAMYPRLAVARDGSVTAVWGHSDGTHDIAQASTRPSRGAWSAPSNLSAAGHNAQEGAVAVAPDGTATAVWRRIDDPISSIQAATTATGSPPIARTAPRISGTPRTGRTLTCQTGTWLYATSRKTAWLRNDRPIRGATKSRYNVTRADARTIITCRVTATGPGGTTIAYSLGVLPRRST